MWIQLQSSWRPALEILILAVAIYYLFRFLRGTRGWPVVIGFVVLLLALALVTTILDFEGVALAARHVLGVFRRGRPDYFFNRNCAGCWRNSAICRSLSA